MGDSDYDYGWEDGHADGVAGHAKAHPDGSDEYRRGYHDGAADALRR